MAFLLKKIFKNRAGLSSTAHNKNNEKKKIKPELMK